MRLKSHLIAGVCASVGLLAVAMPASAQYTVSSVRVEVGGVAYCDSTGIGCDHVVWNLGGGITLNPGQNLVLAQTGSIPVGGNFDTSDRAGQNSLGPSCGPVPCQVFIYINGQLVYSNATAAADPLNAGNQDPLNDQFNEAADWKSITCPAGTDCGAGKYTLAIGYADNEHTDACKASGTENCFPTPFEGANFFIASGVPLGTPQCLSGGHDAEFFPQALSPDGGCYDGGALLITATVPRTPQLAVVKTPDNGVFTMGGQLTYTIVVSNPGTATATNVQLDDNLPANGGLLWQSAATTQGTCVTPIVGNHLSCLLGDIPSKGSVTVTVSTPSTTPLGACQTQFNAAAIATADGGLTAQDSGSYSCTPPAPQLSIVKTPKNGTFNPGGLATFQIVVGNPAAAGSQSATNVILTDNLPGNGGLVWQTAIPTQGICTNPIVGNQLNCQLGTIAPGASVTVNISSTATTPPAACQEQPNPIALATADGGLSVQDHGDLTCQANQCPAGVTIGFPNCNSNPPKTFTIGPSSMEGAIKISAGDWVNGGYSFKFNSTHIATTFSVQGDVTITGQCLAPGGGKLGFTDTITIPLGTLVGSPANPPVSSTSFVSPDVISYGITAGGQTDWLPTGDANSVLSWQGAVRAPATLCGGGGNQLDASKGAVFTAFTNQVPPTASLSNWRFKFRDPAAKGKVNTNCLGLSPIAAENAKRNDAATCGASWSGTKTDP